MKKEKYTKTEMLSIYIGTMFFPPAAVFAGAYGLHMHKTKVQSSLLITMGLVLTGLTTVAFLWVISKVQGL